MPDLYHYYGNDLVASSSGDLLVAGQSDTGTQRVYRRLLTNPILKDPAGNEVASPDYTWHPQYGAGVPRKVGSPTDISGTTAEIRSQMYMESAVTRNPQPQISLTPIMNGINSYISYVDSVTKTPQILSFDVNS